MAPQREGSDEEDVELRPKLATSLQGGVRGGRGEVGETVAKPSMDTAEDATSQVDDDELTSLTWLQNCNLLQGIHRQVSVGALEQLSGDRGGGGGGLSPATKAQPPTPPASDEFYNPTVHRHAKPPYSFSCLIFLAIENSSTKALPVKDIYNWIFSNFPYFRNAPTGWKNSIRHNLSLNKCFYKVDKGQNIAKGSLWCVDPKYRHHLLHSLNKTPNAHYHQGIRLPTFNPPPLPSSSPPPVHPHIREQEELLSGAPSANSGPSPSLFPYLSKRLAASKNQEVDAAATMLALKNGSALDSMKEKKLKVGGTAKGEEDVRPTRTKDDTRVTCRFLNPLNVCVPVLTNRPSKDHTYSTAGESEDEEGEEQPLELTTKSRSESNNNVELRSKEAGGERWSRRTDNVIVIATSAVREELQRRRRRYEEDEEGVRRRRKCDVEEQKIVDGAADALLNLAGIVTSGAAEERPLRRQRKPSRRNLRHLVR